MQTPKKKLGDFGEQLAADILTKRGYTIIGRQVRTPYGEIDLIAEAPSGVLFVEVKTRRTMQFGTPEESITEAKREHIARSVEHYRQVNHILSKVFQVDAITILIDGVTKKAVIRHIENILEE